VKATGLIFVILLVYAVLQIVFDSVWIFVGLLLVLAYALGFWFGIKSAVTNIVAGRVKLP
jgi:hypothetical protein